MSFLTNTTKKFGLYIITPISYGEFSLYESFHLAKKTNRVIGNWGGKYRDHFDKLPCKCELIRRKRKLLIFKPIE